MSKVPTLLKLIAYQREHPSATDLETASAVGITDRYLRDCRKDIQTLASQLSQPILERHELDLLSSMLRPEVGHERAILQKLQGLYLHNKDGVLRIASPAEKPTAEQLSIGLWSPRDDRTHVGFWLYQLLYEPLLWVSHGEDFQYRLAESLEASDGWRVWHLKLRRGVCWSNGAPITTADVEHSLKKSYRASRIAEIVCDGEHEMRIALNEGDVMLPYGLRAITILPADEPPEFTVISGPFRLKRIQSQGIVQLQRNRDYYRARHPKLDSIKLKPYRRFAYAEQAVRKKELDLLPIRSLRQVQQHSTLSTQSFPFRGLSYYLLLVNQKEHVLSTPNHTERLRNRIDYHAISLYLSAVPSSESVLSNAAEMPQGVKEMRELRLGWLTDMPAPYVGELAMIVASSIGIQPLNVVKIAYEESVRASEIADLILTQLDFGFGYLRIRRYFHSEGDRNTFGVAHAEVDSLIDQLDATSSMMDRENLGQQVISLLQRKGCIILLAPSFDYVLSNLLIESSPILSSLTDLMVNLGSMKVERKRVTMRTERRRQII